MTSETATIPAPQGQTIYGIDWGVEGGDTTIEVEMQRQPDGTMMVKGFGEVIEGTCREIKG